MAGEQQGVTMGIAAWARLGAAVSRRPDLWLTALRQGRRMAPRAWWRHAPYLPLPAPDYLRFRLQTMYGGEHPVPAPADVVRWLDWARTAD